MQTENANTVTGVAAHSAPIIQNQTTSIDPVLRWVVIKQLTGVSKETLRQMEIRGDWPKRIRLSARCSGWRESEVKAALDKLAAARSQGGQQ